MKKGKGLFGWRRKLRVLLTLVVLWYGVPVAYWLTPYSLRKPVFKWNPALDGSLRARGLKTAMAWDDLALFGQDRQAQIEPTFRGDHAFGGFPVGRSDVVVLQNEGYVAGYSDALQNPRWVAYRVFETQTTESDARPSSFRVDARTVAKVPHSAYTHSGFDRGHMAPNYAISTRYGRAAQLETFLMSNIVPQPPYINRHIWRELEVRTARRYGQYFGEVWVVTGPVFSANPERLASGVAIPRGYYKIIADELDGQLRVMAFMIPANMKPYSRIRTQLVSIDRLEQLTGLDFFSELPVDVQRQLEAEPASRLWPWVSHALFRWTESP